MIKVKCIDDSGVIYLTKNKIYLSSKITTKWTMIINDKGREIRYYSERFQLVKIPKIIELW